MRTSVAAAVEINVINEGLIAGYDDVITTLAIVLAAHVKNKCTPLLATTGVVGVNNEVKQSAGESKVVFPPDGKVLMGDKVTVVATGNLSMML
jgi:hypothetical protein